MFKTICKILCPLMFFLFFTLLQTSAQTKTVTGKVSDAEGVPLVGATIAVKNYNKAVVTDADGNFSITVPEFSKTATISFVGFVSQEVKIEKVITVILKPETSGLSDVVVVGYGTARKKDVTGAVSSILP